jgi:ABC-type amino acid transport substrate-binding protein
MPVKAEGKLTVVTTGAVAPLSLFATENKALIGNERDLAYAIGEPAAGALHYYDDDSASSLALQSGRAGLTFGPNAATAYKAGKDGKTKQVRTLDGGWPLKAEIAFRTKRATGWQLLPGRP